MAYSNMDVQAADAQVTMLGLKRRVRGSPVLPRRHTLHVLLLRLSDVQRVGQVTLLRARVWALPAVAVGLAIPLLLP